MIPSVVPDLAEPISGRYSTHVTSPMTSSQQDGSYRGKGIRKWTRGQRGTGNRTGNRTNPAPSTNIINEQVSLRPMRGRGGWYNRGQQWWLIWWLIHLLTTLTRFTTLTTLSLTRLFIPFTVKTNQKALFNKSEISGFESIGITRNSNDFSNITHSTRVHHHPVTYPTRDQFQTVDHQVAPVISRSFNPFDMNHLNQSMMTSYPMSNQLSPDAPPFTPFRNEPIRNVQSVQPIRSFDSYQNLIQYNYR